MEIDKKCDGHTVFVKCLKSLTSNDIVDRFKTFLSKYINESGDKIECDYYVNIITNKDDISFGLAFVYITNSEVYYMLFGKNKDGSERCEYIDDPKWIDPPKIRARSNSLKLLEDKKNSLSNSDSLLKVDWSIMMDADEEHERKEMLIKNRHVCPKIKVPLEPLIVPVVNGTNLYNEEFYIEPALPSDVENTCYNHIIKATNVPENITIDDLNNKFRPLITDRTSTYKKKYKGKITEYEYPYIIITNDRTAFIIFDENTNDAKFAIHMAKKTIVKETKLWFVFSPMKDVIDDSDQDSYNRSSNGNGSPHHNRSPNGNKNPNYNRSPNGNGSPNYNRSPNGNSNYNRSPNGSPNYNRSPNNKNFNNNNRSPNKNNNNRNSSNNQSPNNNHSNDRVDKDDNIVDTDGFRYVKYNRK